MRTITGLASAAMLLLLGAGAARADEGFRCGGKIITTGMIQEEVLKYCGEPAEKGVEYQDVRSGNQVVGRTPMYRWTYKSYAATRVLVFDQDTLVKIE